MRVAVFLFYFLYLACTAQETSFFGDGVNVYICQCTGPETNLRCKTKLVSRKIANKITKGDRAAIGKCIASTKFDVCRCRHSTSSTTNTTTKVCTTAKIPLARLVAAVKKNNVNLGPCRKNPANTKVAVCKCSGPESNLKCDTKFLTRANALNTVKTSNGTAVRGKCTSENTEFACCNKVNTTYSKTVNIPAPDVPKKVKKATISFGACVATNRTNSTKTSGTNTTRFF
jgi:hypothetical protein